MNSGTKQRKIIPPTDKMKKMIKANRVVLFLLSIIIGATACQRKVKLEEGESLISTEFSNTKLDSVFLFKLTVHDMIKVDSGKLDEAGKIDFIVKPNRSDFYRLQSGKNNFLVLLVKSGERLTVKADIKALHKSFEVEGSEGSALLAKLNQHKQQLLRKVDTLRETFILHQYDPDFLEIKDSLDSVYYHLVELRRNYITDFIRKNTQSLASILALYEYFGNTPVLTIEDDFEYFEMLGQALKKASPESIHTKDLLDRVLKEKQRRMEIQRAEKRTAIGKTAPDISLPTTDGNYVSLSQYKDKMVLLYFWAGWNAPSRLSNQTLQNLYKKYRYRGFEVFAVSLDQNQKIWESAIQTDQLTWVNVSDLLSWESPVTKTYNITKLPYFIYLDTANIIRQKTDTLDFIANQIRIDFYKPKKTDGSSPAK